MASLNGRLVRIETALNRATSQASAPTWRLPWEVKLARWDAALEEIWQTMDPRHQQLVLDDFADAPEDWINDADFVKGLGPISRELVDILRRCAGYVTVVWHGHLSLPAAVCDALLAHPDARLSYNANCAGCDYRLPYREGAWKEIAPFHTCDADGYPQYLTDPITGKVRRNPDWRNPLIVLRPCPLCGSDDIGTCRYWRTHGRWSAEWQPKELRRLRQRAFGAQR